MPATGVSIKYRPVRIGFLIREGEIEDLTRVASLNTLLWGGIYNPIIPISENNFGEELIKKFNVDVLYPVVHTTEIDSTIKKFPFLRDPYHYGENLFYEDWYTKKQISAFLDIVNTVELCWNHNYKHKPDTYISTWKLIKWEPQDELNNLLTTVYGNFPEIDSKINYPQAYLRGLKGEIIKIDPKSQVLFSDNYPLALTSLELLGYEGDNLTSEALYVGDENNYKDLLNFWNLRASGKFIEFLPIKNKRLDQMIKNHLNKLDTGSYKNPHFEKSIYIYHEKELDIEIIKDRLKEFPTKKRKVFSSLEIKPTKFYFDEENLISAYTDKFYDRCQISIRLPEKKFLSDGKIDQYIGISIDIFSSFLDNEQTTKVPFITELNEFFSREMVTNPWMLRIEENGAVALIEKANKNDINLYTIPKEKIINKIFEISKIKLHPSDSGIIASKIIKRFEGLDGCRVFRIKGVRNLLREDEGEEMPGSLIVQKIYDEGNFNIYTDLYIEKREEKDLTTGAVFKFLLKKDVFRAGLALRCEDCKRKSWLSLKELNDNWSCNSCGKENKTSLQLKNRGDWIFKRNGLFNIDGNQSGSIPVILTLLRLLHVYDLSDFAYLASSNLKFENKKMETDLCGFSYKDNFATHTMEFFIGECKDEGGIIDQDDINNLKLIKQQLEKSIKNKFKCFIIFSKTSGSFSKEELWRIKQINDDTSCIIFTNNELESWWPYLDKRTLKPVLDPIPHDFHEHILCLQDLADNSKMLYLLKI